MHKGRLFILLFVFSILGLTVKAQDLDALQREIKEAENRIKLTTEQLSNNKTFQENRREQLLLTNKNIENRKKIITALDKEVSIYKRGINKNSSEIDKIHARIEDLKKQYSAIVKSGYNQIRQNGYLKFMLAAKSFNDVILRLHYIRIHSSISRTTIAELKAKTTELETKTAELKTKRTGLTTSLSQKAKEVKELDKEQKTFKSELSKLVSEEKNLTSTIESTRKVIYKLQDEIKRIIEEESRKNSSTISSSDREKQVVLSGKFADNKGKLPKPIKNGVVIEKFGIHPHPLQKGITVNNKGVNISASGSADVYSIFEGEVTKVFFFQGLGNSIMVRHGDYISVYSNLSKVNVKTGNKVSTGQRIGTITPSDNSSNSMLHFEIWLNISPENPEVWITE